MKSNRIIAFLNLRVVPLIYSLVLIGQRPRISLKILLKATFFLIYVNVFYGQTEVLFSFVKKSLKSVQKSVSLQAKLRLLKRACSNILTVSLLFVRALRY